MLLRPPSEKHGVAPLFTMNVTGIFHNDAMIRQLTESVRISQVKEDEFRSLSSKPSGIVFQSREPLTIPRTISFSVQESANVNAQISKFLEKGIIVHSSH